MRMKKIATIITALALTVGIFSGCTNKTEDTKPTETKKINNLIGLGEGTFDSGYSNEYYDMYDLKIGKSELTNRVNKVIDEFKELTNNNKIINIKFDDKIYFDDETGFNSYSYSSYIDSPYYIGVEYAKISYKLIDGTDPSGILCDLEVDLELDSTITVTKDSFNITDYKVLNAYLQKLDTFGIGIDYQKINEVVNKQIKQDDSELELETIECEIGGVIIYTSISGQVKNVHISYGSDYGIEDSTKKALHTITIFSKENPA